MQNNNHNLKLFITPFNNNLKNNENAKNLNRKKSLSPSNKLISPKANFKTTYN